MLLYFQRRDCIPIRHVRGVEYADNKNGPAPVTAFP